MVRVICPEYTPILIANFISVIFNTVNNEWSLKEETRTGRGVVGDDGSRQRFALPVTIRQFVRVINW